MEIDTTKVTQAAVSRVFGNWKTTCAGFVLLAVTVIQGVKFDAAGHLDMTEKDWFGIALGLIGAYIGSIQHDAGKQDAQLPGGELAAVDSHEVPNDPNATTFGKCLLVSVHWWPSSTLKPVIVSYATRLPPGDRSQPPVQRARKPRSPPLM